MKMVKDWKISLIQKKMYDLFLISKYINYKTKGFLNFSGFEEFLREIFEINHAKNNWIVQWPLRIAPI